MFRTGILPHQNDYSPDGRLIFNGSLGRLEKPFRENHKKGDRQITVVDATTLKPVRTYKFDAGVRPTVFTKDGTTMYAQLSYLNGVIKFDLQKDDPRKPGAIVNKLSRERSDWSKKTYKDEDAFPHNSAHHGLAMSGDETLLCDCATVEDRVWIVSTADLSVQGIVDLAVDPPGKALSVPYWATTSADGNHCIVSLSGVDQIAVINFRTAQLTRKVPVGDFPQRNRLGRLADEAIRNLTRTP